MGKRQEFMWQEENFKYIPHQIEKRYIADQESYANRSESIICRVHTSSLAD